MAQVRQPGPDPPACGGGPYRHFLGYTGTLPGTPRPVVGAFISPQMQTLPVRTYTGADHDKQHGWHLLTLSRTTQHSSKHDCTKNGHDMESNGDRGDGLVVNLTPTQMCWFVDNQSMNGVCNVNAINFKKNVNNVSPATIRATAASFREGVKAGTSTTMILCPAHPATGNPRLWLKAFCDAEQYIEGDTQVRLYSYKYYKRLVFK